MFKNWKQRKNKNTWENEDNDEYWLEQMDWELEEIEYSEDDLQDEKPVENQEKLEKAVEQTVSLIVQIIFSILTLTYCNKVPDRTSNPNPPTGTSQPISGEATPEFNE